MISTEETSMVSIWSQKKYTDFEEASLTFINGEQVLERWAKTSHPVEATRGMVLTSNSEITSAGVSSRTLACRLTA